MCVFKQNVLKIPHHPPLRILEQGKVPRHNPEVESLKKTITTLKEGFYGYQN